MDHTETFARELDALIDHYRAEFDLTYAQVIGTLTIKCITLATENDDL